MRSFSAWNIAAYTAEKLGKLASFLPTKVQHSLVSSTFSQTDNSYLKSLRYIFFNGMLSSLTTDWYVVRSNFRASSKHPYFKMNLNLRDYVDRRYYFLEENKELADFIKNNLTGDSIYFDIGANVGNTALLAATIVKHVYAFEPEPQCFKKLSENINLNNFLNITAFNKAASTASGSAELFMCINNDGSHSMNEEFMGTVGNTYGQSITVQTVALNDLDLPTPTLVKIDVEGHELSAIQGMTKYLPSISYIYCETNHANLDTLQELLKKYGFEKAYILDKSSGKFIPVAKGRRAKKRLFDVLFVHRTAKTPV